MRSSVRKGRITIRSFEVCAKIGDEEVGRGAGRTKKAAEQVAAYNGILKLKAQEAAAEE